ncbi:hypothetical protein Q9189_005820 [Teloschistes chrysophthalmus]
MADSAATSSFEELSFSIDSISSESKSKIKPRKTTRSCPKPSAIIRDSLGETLFKLNKLVSTRQKPTASIHDLATEIVELVFQHLDLEDDLQALKNLRQVCKGLCEFATPLVFKAISIRRCPSDWEKLNALCLALPLANLELHFLSTSPDRLVDLLEACNHESLCRVRIYRPIWEPEELRHPRMQEYISTLKKDDKVIVEDSEPWNQFGQYSEEEFSFMIESDMFPLEWNMIVPEEGWASDVLNRYVEYRRVALKEEVLVFPGFRPKRDERRMATPTWIPRKGLDYTFIEDL